MGMESSAALALPTEDRAFEIQLALAGFRAGYSGNTRLAYQQDLRQFVSWCSNQDLDLLDVRRLDVELFARWLEHPAGYGRGGSRFLSPTCGCSMLYQGEGFGFSLGPRHIIESSTPKVVDGLVG